MIHPHSFLIISSDFDNYFCVRFLCGRCCPVANQEGMASMNDLENDENYIDEEDLNPFSHMEVDLDDAEGATKRETKTIYRERKWGIPTFQDQIDHGIKTFTMYQNPEFTMEQANHEQLGVTLNLEHRLHSTGSDVWDSALVLAYALNRPGVYNVKGKRILELGSGTGALGLFCVKCLGAQHVILTDLPANLPLLEKNTKMNDLDYSAAEAAAEASSTTSVTITNLDWTQESLPDGLEDFDLIVGSDLFLPFAQYLLLALCQTLQRILIRSSTRRQKCNQQRQDLSTTTVALLCYEERFDCSSFFLEAERLSLHVEHVPNELLHQTYQDPGRIHLLRVTLSSS